MTALARIRRIFMTAACAFFASFTANAEVCPVTADCSYGEPTCATKKLAAIKHLTSEFEQSELRSANNLNGSDTFLDNSMILQMARLSICHVENSYIPTAEFENWTEDLEYAEQHNYFQSELEVNATLSHREVFAKSVDCTPIEIRNACLKAID